MEKEKFTKLLAITAITSLLLVMPTNALFARAYTALITAEGKMRLKGMRVQGDITFNFEANFSALVPSIISPGDYTNVGFHGFAAVTKQEIIKFEGLLTVNGTNFWVKFATEKPEGQDIPEGTYSAEGILSATISEYTPSPSLISWVMMKGKITKYGEDNAFGALTVHAKISESDGWTKAYGFFTLQQLPTETKHTNFSISCYYLTLLNATKTEVNSDEKALYIEGYWNVWNRTVSVTVADNTETTVTFVFKLIREGVPGNLSATLEPSNFTLQIDEMEEINGEVIFYHFRFAKPDNNFNRMIGIPRGDFNRDGMVNIQDIMRIAKAFNAKFGMPGYDFDLDVNADFIINIFDLTAAAQEYGQEY